MGQGQIPDAQLTEHPQDRQGVADTVPALGPEQPGDPPGPECRLQPVRRGHQFQPARKAPVQRVHQVDLLEGADHGRRRGQVTRDVDGPELRADPPRRQPWQVGTGQRLPLVERELLQFVRRHRTAVQGPQRVREIVVPVDERMLSEQPGDPVPGGLVTRGLVDRPHGSP
ncbi:hypothetical protein Axi01nite_02400 [Actinoplanes xinjiangensis]|nr:hypothetical protein Axi01nite_02400 [Actinoplanes xinjiangensis]